MALIDNEDYLYFGVKIEQSLNKERVGNFILLSFVIFESRTIIEGHALNDDLGGNRCLRIFFMTYFDFGI